MTLKNLFIILITTQYKIIGERIGKNQKELDIFFNAYYDDFDFLSINAYMQHITDYLIKYNDRKVSTAVNYLLNCDWCEL